MANTKFKMGSPAEEAKESKPFEAKERKAGKQLPMKGKGDGKMCDYGKGDPNGVMSKGSAAKKAAAGTDMGKPGPGFGKIAAKAGKEYGSAAQGKAVAGSVFQKMRKAGKL